MYDCEERGSVAPSTAAELESVSVRERDEPTASYGGSSTRNIKEEVDVAIIGERRKSAVSACILSYRRTLPLFIIRTST